MRPSLHYGMCGDDPAATIRFLRETDICDLVCDAKQISRRSEYEPALTANELDSFAEPFRREGIRLAAVTIGWAKRDPAGRLAAESLEAVRESIAVLGAGGVPIAQLFDMGPIPKEANRAAYFAGLCDSYRAIVEACASSDVRLAIHFSWLPEAALWNTASVLALFQAVPDPHSGVCFCAGSIWQSGDDVVGSVRALRDRIHHVHFRDADEIGGNCPEMLLGRGKVPFRDLVGALGEIGYDGPVHCEHFGSFSCQQRGEVAAGWAAGFMRGLFQES